MSSPGTAVRLNEKLKPVCPRENHIMSYEAKGIHWKNEKGAACSPVTSYHCSYIGCSVRYTPEQGYFTVVNTPNQPYFVEEPGTNLFRCPQHNTWLYRSQEGKNEKCVWRCGTEDCDYLHQDVAGQWLRQ